MARIGIMQGRLVPPEGNRLQSFPRQRWADEFALASSVPLSYIEWIYDAYGEDVNPIGSANRLEELVRRVEESGVGVRSLCADYFMDNPLLRCTERELAERKQVLERLMRHGSALGLTRIILPFVDASRIDTYEEADSVVVVLREALRYAEETGVEIHLETSLNPGAFAALLKRLPHPMLRVNYDSGNSSALGYAPAEEFSAYGERIGSVHIKDRTLGGGTVPLGYGDTDFGGVFDGLHRLSYAGDFTLQVARGQAGDELEWARRNVQFVRGHWPL